MTPTLDRPISTAQTALARSAIVSPANLVRQQPVKAANIVLASWGIPALTETGEFHGLLRKADSAARSTVEGFVAFVDSYVETKEIEADPEALAAIAEAEAEQAAKVANTILDGDVGTITNQESDVQQDTLPGLEFGNVDGDGDPSRATASEALDSSKQFHAESTVTRSEIRDGAYVGVSDGPAPKDPGVTSALLMNSEDAVRSALLNSEGIVVLRKVSRGKVQGGYSLAVPDLRQAILNSDLSADEIAARIKAAK